MRRSIRFHPALSISVGDGRCERSMSVPARVLRPHTARQSLADLERRRLESVPDGKARPCPTTSITTHGFSGGRPAAGWRV